MRYLVTLAAACLLAACSTTHNPTPTASCGTSPAYNTPAIAHDQRIETCIDSIMQRMALREKVGQMLQLNVTLVCHRDSASGQWVFDDERLRELLRSYRPGSWLNVPSVGGDTPTPQQWDSIIGHIQQLTLQEVGIPTLYGIDHNHGASYTTGATIFPQPINQAATFDTALVRRCAAVAAYESRAGGCPWVFNPTMDLGRDQRWPRLWESFGEDALVNAEMGLAQLRGYQGSDANHIGPHGVGGCIKHYLGYGAPFTGKDRTPAVIAPNVIREKYFEPFRRCLRAGAVSLMVNSASLNGTPLHASYKYLTEWAKDGCQWDGMIITDWADVNSLYTREHVAVDRKDALRVAINAGVDMIMEPYDGGVVDELCALVEEGAVAASRVDDACRRILRLKYRLGLFATPMTHAADYADFACPASRDLALQAAIGSQVLVKNEGRLLPLKPGVRVLVAGPCADHLRSLHGGWTYSWQGSGVSEQEKGYNSIYQALANELGAERVTLCPGVRFNDAGRWQDEQPADIASAVRAARNADVVLCCLGENSYTELEGNVDDLTLSAQQRELCRALAQTGKPMVLVLVGGRPRIINDIEPLCEAVVCAMLPANYGGDALARLLTGQDNFAAKLPFTYPKYINSLSTYDYKVSEVVGTMAGDYDYSAHISLLWPFGHGLSYTTFSYSDLRCAPQTFAAGDTLRVSVTVANTGARSGREVVLLYSSDAVASVTPDCRRLRAFATVDLEPGERKEVSFTVAAKDLAFVGDDEQWHLEPGIFYLTVGDQRLELTCN